LAAQLHKSRLIYIKSINEENRNPQEERLIRKVEQDIVRKTFVDLEGLRTSVYASLIRYLEEKEIIRWRPFDASNDNCATLKDLEEDKMRKFIEMARSKRNFPLMVDTSPKRLLKHLDLIDDDGRLANAAILLFGKKPQKYFVTSEVKCAQFYGNAVEKPMPSYQIYRGDVFEMVDQATSFVMSRVNNWVGTRSEGETADVPTQPELPLDAVKEAIVNAVCHRDYTSNASVQVMLFRNRLEIWNPGTLPFGLTVQKLHEPHKSLPTNPLLADPMYWNGYIEKVGTGTEDIINKCTALGLKEPEFHQAEDFRVVLWKVGNDDTAEQPAMHVAVQPTVQPTVQVTNLLKIFDGEMDRVELQKSLNLSNRDNFRLMYLQPAIEHGFVSMRYPQSPNHPRQKYYLTEKGKEFLKTV
jgi:predicted HTH transcriptional regulator